MEWLDSIVDDLCGNQTRVYPLDLARQKYDVRPLGKNGWLVLKHPADDSIWLEFAVLQTMYECEGKIFMEMIFHGGGPLGALRECRHTHWGHEEDDGYIYYPDAEIITLAFSELRDFFDFH
jgi:hypothetical protein